MCSLYFFIAITIYGRSKRPWYVLCASESLRRLPRGTAQAEMKRTGRLRRAKDHEGVPVARQRRSSRNCEHWSQWARRVQQTAHTRVRAVFHPSLRADSAKTTSFNGAAVSLTSAFCRVISDRILKELAASLTLYNILT